MTQESSNEQLPALLRLWARELGFQQLGITDIDLGRHPEYLHRWLAAGHQGEMAYMERHLDLRERPELLVPKTIRVIAARMDYLDVARRDHIQVLRDPTKGYISRYALGRDYHKIVRRRLARLAARLKTLRPGSAVRAFCDSAPVLEKALAQKAGLGWIGKNTLLLNRSAGSWFFLGEIYTSLELPIDEPPPAEGHCGNCRACLDCCPTGAFIGPMRLDARRCISYLTIEHRGDIPVPLRPLIGNRIFGCDDCQWACPWTTRAKAPEIPDFQPKLFAADLVELFRWDKASFLAHTRGTALRRISYDQWQRNLAVALGNAPASKAVQDTLRSRLGQASPMVRRHIQWALERQLAGKGPAKTVHILVRHLPHGPRPVQEQP